MHHPTRTRSFIGALVYLLGTTSALGQTTAPAATPASDKKAKSEESAAGDSRCLPNGNSTAPCSIEISLESRALKQTLPFDVPVYLTGNAGKEVEALALHVFEGKEPFRVEAVQCGDQDCFQLFQQQAVKTAEVKHEWTLEELSGGDMPRAEAVLSAKASAWRRWPATAVPPLAERPDAPTAFSLRLPPVAANRHVVALVEVERALTDEEFSALKARVAKVIDTVLTRRVEIQEDLNEWLSDSQKEICHQLTVLSGESRVQIRPRAGGQINCEAPADVSRLLGALTSIEDLRSVGSEIRDNVDGCAADLPAIEESLKALAAYKSKIKDSYLKASVESPAPSARGISPIGTADNENPCAGSDLRARVGRYSALLEALKREKRPTDDEPMVAALNAAQSSAETMLGYAEGALPDDLATQKAVAPFVQTLEARRQEFVSLEATTIGTFMTRQRGYLSADFGFAVVPRAERGVPYLGTNIYLVPVNKDAPLKLRSPFSKRFAFSVGVTYQKIESDELEPLFGDTVSLLTGAGIRITESIRLGAGVAWLREKRFPGDPLGRKGSDLRWSPYYSLSFDVDVRDLVNWVNRVFTGTGGVTP